MKKQRFYQGIYNLIHPEKFIGKSAPKFKSNYERVMFRWLDLNKNCVGWGYEILTIPYFDRLQKKIRTYYIDIICKLIDKDGKEKTFALEIKPSKALTKQKGNYAKAEFVNNTDKWTAAIAYCNSKGITFRIISEKDLFN